MSANTKISVRLTRPGRAAILVLLLALLAPTAAQAQSKPTSSTETHSLLQSRNLWATLDICDPIDQPHTVGIRGSMPSDGHPKDTMYMRFRLQYLSISTQKWTDIGATADSVFIALGKSVTIRQAGRSFELVPSASTYTLRGYVEFQWRRKGASVHSVTRSTSTGHTSLAGADPANFSAATCAIG